MVHIWVHLHLSSHCFSGWKSGPFSGDVERWFSEGRCLQRPAHSPPAEPAGNLWSLETATCFPRLALPHQLCVSTGDSDRRCVHVSSSITRMPPRYPGSANVGSGGNLASSRPQTWAVSHTGLWCTTKKFEASLCNFQGNRVLAEIFTQEMSAQCLLLLPQPPKLQRHPCGLCLPGARNRWTKGQGGV